MADIGPKIVLEGEKEYRKAISEINKDMKVLTSEMRATSAEFDGNANSIEALRKKSEILNKEYDEQVKKIRTLQGAMEKAEEVYGANSNQVKDWQIKLNNAEAELKKLDKELQTNNKYLDEAEKSTDGTAKSIDKYGKEVKEAEKETKDFNEELDKVKSGVTTFGKAAGAAIIGLGTALIGVTESTKEFRQDFARLEQNAKSAGANIEDVSKELKNLEVITGETDSNVEALSNLMATGFKGTGLTKAVEALSGAVIKFPDTLKIEGLADGLQETLATGKAIGPFSEMLERLGYNLDDFNIGLANATTEAEQQNYVLKVLANTGLANVTKEYKQANKTQIEYEEAQFELKETMADIADAAAPALTKGMKGLSKSLSEVADDALPKVEDGLEWIMDNADTVASGIGGITVAIGTFKAVDAITTAVDAWKKYKLATEGATVAQYALNIAQSLNPTAIIAAGVVGATTALGLYVRMNVDATTETQAFTKETNELIKSSQNLEESLKDSAKARQENYKAVEAEYGAAKILADSLYDLQDKENLSNAEKKRMQALVEELNSSIPDLNLSIDEQTGLLNKQRGEVDQLIDSQLELALAQAKQEDMSEIAEELYSKQKDLYELTQQREEAQAKLNEKEREFNELSKESIANIDEFGNAAEGTSNQLLNTQTEMEELEKDIKNLDGQIVIAKDSTADLTKQYEDTNNMFADTTGIDGATTAIVEYGGKTIQVAQETATAMNELTIKFNEEVEAQKTSIHSQMGLFDEFIVDMELTSTKMLENLQTQIDGMSNWAKNVEELADKGINKGLLQELIDMGPAGAGYVATLNNMTGTELEKMNKSWEERLKIEEKVANEMADVSTEYSDGIEKAIKEGKKEAEKSDAVGSDMIEGLKKGMENNKVSLWNLAGNIAGGMITASRKALKSNSPSKAAIDIGEDYDDGLAIGIVNKKDLVYKKAEEMAGALATLSIPSELGNDNISNIGSISSNMSTANVNTGSNPLFVLEIGEFNNYTSEDLEVLADDLAFMTKRRLEGGGISVGG